MVNEHILSQIVNENEREVFKSMRSDMSSAKALLNDEQFNTFMRAATINQSIPEAEINTCIVGYGSLPANIRVVCLWSVVAVVTILTHVCLIVRAC